MRAFLLSIVILAVLAVGAYYALNSDRVPFSSAERTAGEAVRLD